MSMNLTYEQLKTVMRERAGTDGLPSIASLPNAISALNGFLGALELTERAVIKDVMRDGFSTSLDRMVARMQSDLVKPTHIKNRRSALQHWHRLLRTLDHECAARDGTVTPFQARLRQLHGSLRGSKRRFYQRCGLSKSAVQSWMNGTAPRNDSFERIIALEQQAELPAGTLIGLLPYNRIWELRKRSQNEVLPAIDFRQRVARTQLDRRNNPDHIPVLLSDHEWTSEMRAEWVGLLAYKTGLEPSEAPSSAALGHLRSAMAVEDKGARKQWRLRPQAEYPALYEPWVADIGGFRAPTAGMMFAHLCAFFGWIRLPVTVGGKGGKVESMTLGLVSDKKLLLEYIEWRTVRAGGTNKGVSTFLGQVRMLVHPQTGYLPKHPEIGNRVGIENPAEWIKRCAAAKTWTDQTMENIAHLIRPTRDPAEPIRSALQCREPLDPFIEGLRRYAREVSDKVRDRSTRSRDLLLFSLTMTNPLRAANLRLLTYRPDNTGNFRKRPDGSWELFIPSEQFKNFRGAAKDDYCQNIDPAVWPFLEDYLDNHRAVLAPCERGLVFVAKTSQRTPHGSGPEKLWKGIDIRFRRFTQSYVSGCPGVGPHALRYVVGTSIIMRTKGDYVLSAKVLHDLPETVRRHYAKLLQEFANRGRDEVLGPVLATIHSSTRMESGSDPGADGAPRRDRDP